MLNINLKLEADEVFGFVSVGVKERVRTNSLYAKVERTERREVRKGKAVCGVVWRNSQ